jgi:hypothetical protein
MTNKIDIDLDAAEMSEFIAANGGNDIKSLSCDSQNPNTSTLDNALVNAVIHWKELELDFFIFAISKINPFSKNFDGTLRLSLRDFADIKSRDYSYLIKELRKKTVGELLPFFAGLQSKMVIKINDKSIDQHGFEPSAVRTIITRIPVDTLSFKPIFGGFEVDLKQGEIELKFMEWLLPYVSDINKNFTSIHTKSLINLKGVQSKQLLMLMMMIPIGKGVKEKDAWVRRRTFSRAEYKEYLGMSENSYIKQDGSVDYKNFRARGVKTVMQRINDSGKYLLQVDFKDQQADFFTITMIPS